MFIDEARTNPIFRHTVYEYRRDRHKHTEEGQPQEENLKRASYTNELSDYLNVSRIFLVAIIPPSMGDQLYEIFGNVDPGVIGAPRSG